MNNHEHDSVCNLCIACGFKLYMELTQKKEEEEIIHGFIAYDIFKNLY